MGWAMAMRGARRQGDPLQRSGPAPERAALLAPALLLSAVAFVGVGAGGIDRLASLGEIATGPAPPGEQVLGSGSRAHENAVVSALTNRTGAHRRSSPGGGAAGEGSRAGSAATGVADLSAPASAAVAPVSPPSSGPGGGSAGGGESLVPDPVGRVPDAAPPVRDRVAPIERVVDELLDEFRGQQRVPSEFRKLKLRPGD